MISRSSLRVVHGGNETKAGEPVLISLLEHVNRSMRVQLYCTKHARSLILSSRSTKWPEGPRWEVLEGYAWTSLRQIIKLSTRPLLFEIYVDWDEVVIRKELGKAVEEVIEHRKAIRVRNTEFEAFSERIFIEDFRRPFERNSVILDGKQ